MLFAIEAQNLTFKRELYYIGFSSQMSNEDYFNFIERKRTGRLPYRLIEEVIGLSFSKSRDAISLKHYPFLITAD